ncbi:MAG: hypothetical protein NTV24_03560 [Candidatus Woesebacteria bacterium]|nr:hypothetical protein [Candidatus Woesebacteria bacterium]
MLDANFWKKYFKTYDILNIVIPYRELIEKFIKELAISRGDLVLDAGAGTGNLAIKFKQLGTADLIDLYHSVYNPEHPAVKKEPEVTLEHEEKSQLSITNLQ